MTVHRFFSPMFDGYFLPFLRLRCIRCSLKVSARVASQLEGLPCR